MYATVAVFHCYNFERPRWSIWRISLVSETWWEVDRTSSSNSSTSGWQCDQQQCIRSGVLWAENQRRYNNIISSFHPGLLAMYWSIKNTVHFCSADELSNCAEYSFSKPFHNINTLIFTSPTANDTGEFLCTSDIATEAGRSLQIAVGKL